MWKKKGFECMPNVCPMYAQCMPNVCPMYIFWTNSCSLAVGIHLLTIPYNIFSHVRNTYANKNYEYFHI